MRNSIFQKLAAEEHKFNNSVFMAPIYSNKVLVRIDGILSKYDVEPKNFVGWAQLKPSFLTKKASVRGNAPGLFKRKYLEVLPSFSLVVTDIEKSLGYITNTDNRITTNSPVRFYLAENVELFDTIQVGFDGANFIYNRPLRSEFGKLLNDYLQNNNSKVKLPKGYKEAYQYNLFKKQQELLGNKEYQIKSAIEKAGGQYRSFSDVDNSSVKVSYTIDGESYTSTLSNNLEVISAGICLSGGDKAFDLQSLISVVKEGQERSLIYRF